MASVDWPWDLATIRLRDYAIGRDTNVGRTSFETGAVEQKRKHTRVMGTREFQVDVKLSNVVAFETFLDDHAGEFFNFKDFHDKVTREMRIRGGAAGIRLVMAEDRLDGERYMSSPVFLEGFK